MVQEGLQCDIVRVSLSYRGRILLESGATQDSRLELYSRLLQTITLGSYNIELHNIPHSHFTAARVPSNNFQD